MTCEHSRYKPIINMGKTFVVFKKLRYFTITHKLYRGYSCYQRQVSTWHDTNHMMWWMEWWCIILSGGSMKTLYQYTSLFFNWIKEHASWLCIYIRIQPIRVICCFLFLLAGLLTIYNLTPEMCMRPKFMLYT
jgi:hypothetical protein